MEETAETFLFLNLSHLRPESLRAKAERALTAELMRQAWDPKPPERLWAGLLAALETPPASSPSPTPPSSRSQARKPSSSRRP